MKNIIAVVCLLSLASLAFAESLPKFPFVTSDGHAEVELSPNIAEVSFGLKAFHENPDNAVDTIRQRSKELLEFCTKQKIKREDIVAYEINKNIVREHKGYQERQILGYEVIRRFTITLHDIQGYEPFAKKLLSMKNVEKMDTVFDRTDREKIESDLLSKASADAKRQAERLAKCFDAQIDSVYAIAEQGFSYIEEEFIFTTKSDRVDLSGSAEEKELILAPSTIKFENGVSAIFKLKIPD